MSGRYGNLDVRSDHVQQGECRRSALNPLEKKLSINRNDDIRASHHYPPPRTSDARALHSDEEPETEPGKAPANPAGEQELNDEELALVEGGSGVVCSCDKGSCVAD